MLLRKNPASPNKIAFIPILLLIKKSISNPKITPAEIPYAFPKNSPINKTKIINKFGFIPAILNQLKKFICKKYRMINVINNITIDNIFFIFVLSELEVYLINYITKFCKTNADITPIKYNPNTINIFSF